MKWFRSSSALCALAAITVLSCHKNNSELAQAPSKISGKWNLAYDSTYVGAGYSNHLEVHIGKPPDYFDFGSGGNLEVNEDGVQSDLKYALYPRSKIVISSFGLTLNGFPDTCIITDLTLHTMVITSHFYPTPGGLFGRKVILFR